MGKPTFFVPRDLVHVVFLCPNVPRETFNNKLFHVEQFQLPKYKARWSLAFGIFEVFCTSYRHNKDTKLLGLFLISKPKVFNNLIVNNSVKIIHFFHCQSKVIPYLCRVATKLYQLKNQYYEKSNISPKLNHH